MTEWTDCKDRLPAINQVVIVCYPSGYDGSPLYAWGARCDGCEDEHGNDAWCWGIGAPTFGISPGMDAGHNGIEVDDDYDVTHWMPLPEPPHREPS